MTRQQKDLKLDALRLAAHGSPGKCGSCGKGFPWVTPCIQTEVHEHFPFMLCPVCCLGDIRMHELAGKPSSTWRIDTEWAEFETSYHERT